MLVLRLLVALVVACGFTFAQETEIGKVVIPFNGIGSATYEIDWDVNPNECQSKMYEWVVEGKLKCVGRVIQESGIPLLEPGLRGAIMEKQRDFHVGAQNMYRLQAAAYLTQPWLDFKNAETVVKALSQDMQKMQDVARVICEDGNTEYDGPTVGCIKTETALGIMAKALTTDKDNDKE